MADRVYWYTHTVPAQTAIATPFTANMVFNAADVDSVVIIVPPGPAGNVGFQILSGGGQFLPQTPGQFIVADDYTFKFDQDKAPNNGNYQFSAYNLDLNPHVIQVGFEISDFSSSQVPASSTVSL